jgi:hypothetical protein
MLQSSVKFWTIGSLEEARQIVNSNPVHQRPQRGLSTNNTSKAQGIIRSLKNGVVSMITVCKVDDEQYQYESIDGGHRKRAIIDYLNCRFKVDGKYFRELSDEERKAFRDIILPVCVYENISGPEIGNIFRSINKTDHVSHQENLNSYGTTPIANAIRSTVRLVDGASDTPHALFNYTITPRSNKISYQYLTGAFNNEQLKQEQWVARLYYYFINGGKISVCGEDQLEEMYDSNPDQATVDAARVKVNELLNYVLRHANIRNTDVGGSVKMNDKIANLFVRFYFHALENYGAKPQFKLDDGFTESAFHHAVMKVYHEIVSCKDTFTWNGFKSEQKDQTIAMKFTKNLSEYRYDTQTSTMSPVTMILSKVNMQDYIIIKDKRKSFPKQVREAKLYAQDFTDPATGKRINMDTGNGDHHIPRGAGIAAGGVTEDHNCVMVSKEYNQKKSNKMPG